LQHYCDLIGSGLCGTIHRSIVSVYAALTSFSPLLRSFSAEALSVKHLSSTIECLRSFQAAQRFRKGVNAGNYTADYIAASVLFCSCAYF
jgi:hypothetical protein